MPYSVMLCLSCSGWFSSLHTSSLLLSVATNLRIILICGRSSLAGLSPPAQEESSAAQWDCSWEATPGRWSHSVCGRGRGEGWEGGGGGGGEREKEREGGKEEGEGGCEGRGREKGREGQGRMREVGRKLGQRGILGRKGQRCTCMTRQIQTLSSTRWDSRSDSISYT